MEITSSTHSIWRDQEVLKMPGSLDLDLRLLVIGSLVDLFGRLTKPKQNLFDVYAKLLTIDHRSVFVELCE